jgi:2-hydroxychromene-2-carboxylate isomerase
MARTLEFYFDYGSPYSYLADTQVEAIAQRTGATLERKPMLLGGVFKATGNHSPAELPAKSKWSAFDMPIDRKRSPSGAPSTCRCGRATTACRSTATRTSR